jgi:hypothetical protein
MMSSRPDCPQEWPSQADIDAFRHAGIGVMSLARPQAMKVAVGDIAPDCRFEPNPRRERWFVFDEAEADDIVFWQRQTGRLATWSGRAFALGQPAIDEAATYSFDCSLNIFDDPLDWLRSRRDGIVVLDWTRAFDRLRDAPRIALAERLLPIYRRHMRPAHLPELSIIPAQRRAA